MDKEGKILFNFRPAVIVSAGLIVGIVLGYLYKTLNNFMFAVTFFAVIMILVTLSAVLIVKKKYQKGISLLLTGIFFVFGALSTHSQITKYENYSLSGETEMQAVVIDISSFELVDGEFYYNATVKGKLFDYENVKASVKFYSANEIFVGTSVTISGNFYKKDFSNYVFTSEIYYGVYGDATLLDTGDIVGVHNKIKHKLLINLNKTMSSSTYGVNYALLTGDTQYIDADILTLYREVGIAHVFAVSGLHIGLMYGVLSLLSKLTGLKGKSKFILSTLILALYVAFCGFSASSIRTFVIIVVYGFCDAIGLKADKTSSLSLSAIVVLLFNRSDLFSVGFLLSFSVYAGLVLLTKPLEEFFSRFMTEKLSKLLAPYISAHIVSLPILLEFFGYVQPLSFVFNIVIVPLISFFYAFSLLGAVLVMIFPIEPFSIIPNFLFTACETLLTSVNTKAFMITNVNFSYSLIPYYLLLYSLTGKINLSGKTMNFLRIILVISFIFLVTFINLGYKP